VRYRIESFTKVNEKTSNMIAIFKSISLLEDVPFGFELLMDGYLAVRVKETVTIPSNYNATRQFDVFTIFLHDTRHFTYICQCELS
jgi:hypothetical protein